MEQKTTFGKFIQQKRKEKDLTQKELADHLYVTESAVSKWERGISYPDITLVSAICEELGITEHELITASEDYKQKEIEKQAKSYQKMLAAYKWFFIGAYAVTLITCFICNLAIDHKLSWFFIVLASLLVAFSFTTVPVLTDKNRSLWVLGSFFVSLNLLFAVCRILLGGNWYIMTVISVTFGFSLWFLPWLLQLIHLPHYLQNQKALIYFTVNTLLLLILIYAGLTLSGAGSYVYRSGFYSAAYGLIFAWSIFFVIRYAKINGLFKTSICLFLTGLATFFTNPVMAVLIEHKKFMLPSVDFSDWSNNDIINGNVALIVLLSMLVLGLVFVIGGIMLQVKRAERIKQ